MAARLLTSLVDAAGAAIIEGDAPNEDERPSAVDHGVVVVFVLRFRVGVVKCIVLRRLADVFGRHCPGHDSPLSALSEPGALSARPAFFFDSRGGPGCCECRA